MFRLREYIEDLGRKTKIFHIFFKILPFFAVFLKIMPFFQGFFQKYIAIYINICYNIRMELKAIAFSSFNVIS